MCLFVHAKILTHCISRVLKMRGRRNILMGTVMMRTNGKAKDATVDMTAHRIARQITCIAVNRCIRSVRTWGTRQKPVLPSVLLPPIRLL